MGVLVLSTSHFARVSCRQYSRLSANESDSTSDTERRARRRRTSTRSASEKSVHSKGKPEKPEKAPLAAGAKLTEEESAQVGSVRFAPSPCMGRKPILKGRGLLDGA